jgi:hypothetical protein
MCTQTNHFQKQNPEQCDCGCHDQIFHSRKKKLEMLNNYLTCLQDKEADAKEAIQELEGQK